MKRQTNFLYCRTLFWLAGLIFFAGFIEAQAQTQPQRTVFPRACVETDYATFNTTLASGQSIGDTRINTNGRPVSSARMIINPGGQNEEIVPSSSVSRTINAYFLLNADGSTYSLTKAHDAGEPVQLISDAIVRFGYHNTTSSVRDIPQISQNGIIVGSINTSHPSGFFYQSSSLPTQFQPGIHENVISYRFNTGTISWHFLDGNQIEVDNSPQYRCGTITYQGCLSDGAAAANGLYDLRFQAFDTATGGTVQSESLVVENAPVTNGIFTVNLFLGSSLTANLNAKFLEIAVRPGASSGTDPFTILTPRQPITTVPYAVNAQTADNAMQLDGKKASQFLQISPSGAQTGNLNISGNGTIGGNVVISGNITVNGTISGTLPAGSGSYIQNTTTQQANSNFNVSGNGVIGGTLTATGNATFGNNLTVTGNASIGGNLTTTGTITSGCRSGFTAFAFGRLCVSELKPSATFFGANGAQQTCANLNARVGTATDVAQTFGTSGFNYFGSAGQGWLGDYAGDNRRAVWNVPFVTPDFDGDALHIYTGGANNTAPVLPFRCVY